MESAMSNQTPRLRLDYGSSVFYNRRRHVICQESSDFVTVALSDPESGKVVHASISDLSPYSDRPQANS